MLWSYGFRTGYFIEDRVVVEDRYSGWRSVSSGVSQRYVLGSPFVSCIDDLYVRLVSKFADGVKIGGIAISEEGCQIVQLDLRLGVEVGREMADGD